jgi:protoporphyrinogen oxidase
VINTIPLNRFASLISGTDDFSFLSELDYLNVIFVFVRLNRPSLLKTEWTWIPDPSVPFYRISEMKVLNESHAPKGCTGLCLEASPGEANHKDSKPKYWTRLAVDFLKKSFSISDREIIGMNVEQRDAGYPKFLKKNTRIISRLLSKPYVLGEHDHHFLLPINNLALAGRAGTFLYLLTPGAINSGLNAANLAQAYLTTRRTQSY